MAGFTTLNDSDLRRTNLWSRQMKELLLDDLFAIKFVKVLTDFPDGVTFNIPSLGEAETFDFSEGKAIKYNKMDTGNYTFTFTQYKGSAEAISAKFKRDSYYSAEVEAAFVPRQHRALMEAVETRILSRGNASQTASNPNTINSADHRWVGAGSSAAIALADFAKARYAIHKANVPPMNLVAIVDPSVAYTIATQTNAVNLLSPQPMWDSMVRDGIQTGFKFRFNIYDFDVYVSNYLPAVVSETVVSGGVSRATNTTGVCNYMFSAAPGDTLPWIGGFREMPTVYSEFNKDLQQWEYLTIAEYDFQTYRPENVISVLTDTDVVV